MATARLTWFVALVCGCAAPQRMPAPAGDVVAIVGVTVIDPSSSAAPAADQTILIDRGAIRAVGGSSSVTVPAGARIVNARGKFAIPGLWDMHVHFMNAGVTALPVLVAHGVTSVREMGGFLDSTRVWQTRMKAGTLVGPRIITPGPILESPRYLQGKLIFGEPSRRDERRPYASPWLLGWWRMQVDERKADTSATPPAVMEPMYRSAAADVRGMHDAGVPILAGTDAGSVLVYPGFSLHEELRLMVEDARLSPLEALRAATVAPARFLGLTASLGTVAAGKIADIVLLDADPLADIRNTRRVFAVIQGGRVFERGDLDRLLATVRSSAP